MAALGVAAAGGRLEAAPAPGAEMDYGPFLTGSLDRDKKVSEKNSNASTEQDGPSPNALAAKAVVVKLGGGAAVAFDTDLLRYAAGWTGGFVDLDKTHLTTPKGSTPLAPKGELVFVSPSAPGMADSGPLKDVRPHPFGPLPKDFGSYRGLYRDGTRIVFSYTIQGADVLDSPSIVAADGATALARTLWIGPSDESLVILPCGAPRHLESKYLPGDGLVLEGPEESIEGTGPPTRLVVGIPERMPKDVKVDSDGHGTFEVPPRKEPLILHFFVRRVQQHALQETVDLLRAAHKREDLSKRLMGSPARSTRPITTKGTLGTGNGAYVVDTLTLPDDNPWHAWIRPSGLDFFSDGRLAVCTLNGDVWVVSGVDEKLERLEWRRFASGLYEPLGLRVVKDEVYVLGRDQITRLHDLNHDGEADFYENFNNDAPASANYHGFAFDLDIDSKGNFYYTRAGQRMSPKLAMHGALLRVSPDGSKIEPIAAGLRAANGLCVGPNDLITVADNQGNWTPSSRINVIEPGGFYGWMPHVLAAGGKPRTDYDPPLCWIPITVDNSSGSQVWATDERFGPLSGRMFHTSYGHACLMLGFVQKLDDGLYQGGVIKMPFRFDSGVMRGRVNPKDGQLYLCGLRGWQTDGTRDGTLVRVRYTGKKLYMPTDWRVVPGGIELTFSQPLDPATAEDVGSYGIEQWNYLWGEQYGSPEYSVKEPKKQGKDEVTVASAKLMEGGKKVMLSVPDIKPVMQMQINVDVDAADGTNIRDTMWVTINGVPAR